MPDLKIALSLTLKDLASRGVNEFTAGFRRGMEGVRADADRTGAALRAGMQSISTQLATLQRMVIAYHSIVGTLRAGAGIARVADDFRSLQARLVLATGGLEAAGRAMDEVRRIAAANGQELQAVGTLYARLATAIRDMGGSQDAAARTTEAVTLALRISGAGAAEAASATLQLSQAFASGVLRGEEFNSINEAAPRIMQALAEHLGVSRGKLRELAEQGKITAEVMGGALLGNLERLRGEAKQLPDTLEQATTRIKNAWMELVARFDESTGASSRLSGAMNEAAENLDVLLQTGRLLGEGVLIVLAGRMLNTWRAAQTGATALGLLGAAAGGVFRGLGGWPTLLLALGVGAAKAGYEIAKAVDTAVNGDRDLVAARQKSAAALGALLERTEQYRDTLVLSAAEVGRLTDTELKAYRDRLAGAVVYYNALYEAEARRGEGGDAKAKAQAAAERDAYVAAISAIKPILAERRRLEKEHTGAIKRTQEELAPQIKAALDAQTKAYQDAAQAVEMAQQRRKSALQAQAKFEKELLSGPKKKPEEATLTDFSAGLAASREAAAAGDVETAMKGVEALREQLRAMKEAGVESTLVLTGLAKEAATIENLALSRGEDSARADKDQAFNDLLALQKIAKNLEAIKIGIDQPAAEQALQAAQEALQAFADRHPIIQRVIVQAQDQMLLDANDTAPKKAAGGLISGPGHDSSDNLLAWLSPGEFVMRAAAVRRWGVERLAALNAGRLPQFAAGGPVLRAVASVPRFAAGGPMMAPEFPYLGRIDLGLGGANHPVYAAPDVAAQIRREALMWGTRWPSAPC